MAGRRISALLQHCHLVKSPPGHHRPKSTGLRINFFSSRSKTNFFLRRCNHRSVLSLEWSSSSSFHCWRQFPLCRSCANSRNTLPLTEQHSHASKALHASEQIQANDPRADWSALSVRLNAFHTVLHKVVLPTEWNLDHVIAKDPTPLVVKCYTHIRNTFDGSNPLHQ